MATNANTNRSPQTEDNDNKDEETDSSGSEYDDIDTGMVKKATRKIKKVIQKINPFSSSSEKYKEQAERLYSDKSPNVYDFNHERSGCCIIINNDRFVDMDNRDGSSCDVASMKTEFIKLGFDVKIYNNLSATHMHKKLRKVCMKYDHDRADCFVCILLSHGGENYDIKRERSDIVFGSDGQFISVADIMEIFSDSYCPKLIGKPRLFFIQACRGTKMEKGVKVKLTKKEFQLSDGVQLKPYRRTFKYESQIGEFSVDAADAKGFRQTRKEDLIVDDLRKMTIEVDEEQEFIDYKKGLDSLVTTPSPCYTDSLVMFASPPGYFAFRRDSGSWFIKSLTYVLRNSPKNKTVQQMLTQVSYEMSMNYSSKSKKHPEIDGCVTVPCVMSMLTKDIFFTPKISNST